MKKTIVLITLLFSFVGSAQSNADQPTLQETQISKKVKVFPNPATSVVNILGLQNSAKATIVISDVNGNVVLQHQWAIRRKALNIPISDLNPGIYVVSIRSEEQQVYTKFYKQ